MSLTEYINIICAILDIPVHGPSGTVESLHTLFSLYSAFKENQHFQAVGEGGAPGGVGVGSKESGGGADILSLS